MSRFFATGGSDSESESSSEEEQVINRPAAATFTVMQNRVVFLYCHRANSFNSIVYSLAMKRKKLSVWFDQQKKSVMKIFLI